MPQINIALDKVKKMYLTTSDIKWDSNDVEHPIHPCLNIQFKDWTYIQGITRSVYYKLKGK